MNTAPVDPPRLHTEIRSMVLAALFAALTAIGAFIQVPLGFTSITLQVLFSWAELVPSILTIRLAMRGKIFVLISPAGLL